jgi:hypothetical protein
MIRKFTVPAWRLESKLMERERMELTIDPPALEMTQPWLGRPFTDPWWVAQDRAVLAYAMTLLRAALAESALAKQGRDEQAALWIEKDGRQHRLIINNEHLLCTLPHLRFVGFFGQRRRNVEGTQLMDKVVAIDDALVAELTEHPGIVAYCSCELASGEYGNLVLLADEQAKTQWNTGARHHYVAHVLAPHYYRSVRLHNGSILGGLPAGHAPVIERTQYYDYGDRPSWHATTDFVA